MRICCQCTTWTPSSDRHSLPQVWFSVSVSYLETSGNLPLMSNSSMMLASVRKIYLFTPSYILNCKLDYRYFCSCKYTGTGHSSWLFFVFVRVCFVLIHRVIQRQRQQSQGDEKHTCTPKNTCVTGLFSLFLSRFSFLRQADHYDVSTSSILCTETSLCSVWETVGVNSINHTERCHSEGSRDTFTV